MATGGPKATGTICTDGFCRKSYEPCIYFLGFIFVSSLSLSFHVYLRLFSSSSLFFFYLFPSLSFPVYIHFFSFSSLFFVYSCFFIFSSLFFFLISFFLSLSTFSLCRSFSLFSHHLFLTFCFSSSFCSPLSPFPFVLRISSSSLYFFLLSLILYSTHTPSFSILHSIFFSSPPSIYLTLYLSIYLTLLALIPLHHISFITTQ